jgi:hypothetical protein
MAISNCSKQRKNTTARLGESSMVIRRRNNSRYEPLQVKRPLACVRHERGTTMIATERNEIALSGFLKSLQTPRHKGSLRPATNPLKPKPGLN